jgi:ribulose-phosphate 3-epimerase
MVDNPEHHFEQIKRAGGDSVTFHVEVSDEPWNTIKAARALDLGVGVAFNPETEVEQAVEASLGADLVLCMSIHPGYSGQEFLPESLWRIRRLRKQLHENLYVQVDGGITAENLHDVRKVGADLIVAGSAVFGMEDLPRAYRRLAKALDDPA